MVWCGVGRGEGGAKPRDSGTEQAQGATPNTPWGAGLCCAATAAAPRLLRRRVLPACRHGGARQKPVMAIMAMRACLISLVFISLPPHARTQRSEGARAHTFGVCTWCTSLEGAPTRLWGGLGLGAATHAIFSGVSQNLGMKPIGSKPWSPARMQEGRVRMAAAAQNSMECVGAHAVRGSA